MKKYSISQAAEMVGVDRATVYRWIRRKVVPPPLIEVIAGVEVTYWTDAEISKLRAYKKESYWGRGKKKAKGRGIRKTKS